MIRAGTPLYTVAEIEMTGRFSLGTKEAPNCMAMTAHQVLAAPNGFVWSMSARDGTMRISGSDAAADRQSWTRFWLMGLIPVARIGGTEDHRRSAFGRYVAEATFWTPAALLPGPGITSAEVDETTARLTITHEGLEESVDVTIDSEGRPVKVVSPRWSDANPETAQTAAVRPVPVRVQRVRRIPPPPVSRRAISSGPKRSSRSSSWMSRKSRFPRTEDHNGDPARHDQAAARVPIDCAPITSTPYTTSATAEPMADISGSGLLVMGAYEHSPFGEALFGGPTRDVLRRSKIPVLVAH